MEENVHVLLDIFNCISFLTIGSHVLLLIVFTIMFINHVSKLEFLF